MTAVVEKGLPIPARYADMAASKSPCSSVGEATLRQALDLSCEGIVILRVNGDAPCICYANSQFTRLSGFTLGELADRSWADVCGDIGTAEIAETVNAGGSFCGTLLMHNADGSRWRAGVRIRPLNDAHGAAADRWLCQFIPPSLMSGEDSDVPQIWFDQDCVSPRHRFGRLDRIDSSSGLLRFERFREFLDRDLAMAAREKKSATLAVLKILEFSEYRCTFGVNAARSCLAMIGKQVTASLRRRTDLCARMDDDSIVIAVIGQSADDLTPLAGRICAKVDALGIHNPRGRRSRFLSLHAGIASCDVVSRSCTIESLIDSATQDLESESAESLTA